MKTKAFKAALPYTIPICVGFPFVYPVLQYAVVGLLVAYCLKDTVFTYYHGLSELIAICFISIFHKWKKKTLLSIGAGTGSF